MISILGHHVTVMNLFRSAAMLTFGAVGISIMACSLYGWGRLARRLAGLPNGTWPVSVAVGLACIVFLGGILSLCRLAFPAALAGIVVIGLALTSVVRREDRFTLWKLWDRGSQWQMALSGAVVLIVIGFTITFSLAPSIYNAGDDFQHYFPYAVRMVETGTFYGSRLNGLGGITFGAQAFLQSFIVGFFPIRFINGADAIFCFFLCLILPIAITIGRPNLWTAGLAGTFAAFLIDPQYISVSALFSMIALFATLVILSVDPREGGEDTVRHFREAIVPALLYAGVIALKPTGIVFLSLYFGTGVFLACLRKSNARANLIKAVWVAAWSLIFISPWLLLYSPYYLSGLTSPIGPPSSPVPEIHVPFDITRLFSPAPTFYGTSRLAYTCVAVSLLSAAVAMVIIGIREPSKRLSWNWLAAAAAAGASYFLWVVVGPHLDEPTSMLRYSIPALIATTSTVLPLSAMLTARSSRIIGIFAGLALAILFADSTRERASRLLHEGNALAYLHSWSSGGISRARHATDAALSEDTAQNIRSFQDLIPPGERVLVWTVTQFLLNYRRNNIIDMNLEGLGKSWSRIPTVRYVLWQHSGYSVYTPELNQRTIAVGRHTGALSARAFDVTLWRENAAASSKVLRDEDGIVLFEIGEGTLAPPDPSP